MTEDRKTELRSLGLSIEEIDYLKEHILNDCDLYVESLLESKIYEMKKSIKDVYGLGYSFEVRATCERSKKYVLKRL